MDTIKNMKRVYLILFFIVLLSIFFRSYQLVERFEFAHDGDLYSWIVKDIVIDHHFRLIGQLTSANGIFIGPFFYYLLIPFFLLTKMDPIGVTLLGVVVGVLTVISYYFVLSKLFNKTVGIIAAFLHAVLVSTISYDRWIVPTIFTKLWAIWYLYVVLMISRGNFSVLPILGILIGLIWHVHIALIPALATVPVAFISSKRFPTKKQIILFFIYLTITSMPFIFFELRHNFQQTFGLINNFFVHREGPIGFYKFSIIIEMIIKNITSLFFESPRSFGLIKNILFFILIIFIPLFLSKQKILSLKDIITLYFWFFGVLLFFLVSSSPISEYYFSNIEVIVMTSISLSIYLLIKKFAFGKWLALIMLFIISVNSIIVFVNHVGDQKGYLERKSVANYIINDAKEKKFPCFSLNYITSPGENVGFRYFLFLKNAHIAVPGRGSPVYSIVIPDSYASSSEIKVKFGHIGIIPPVVKPPEDLMKDACSGANTNLTDPFFGYVE